MLRDLQLRGNVPALLKGRVPRCPDNGAALVMHIALLVRMPTHSVSARLVHEESKRDLQPIPMTQYLLLFVYCSRAEAMVTTGQAVVYE